MFKWLRKDGMQSPARARAAVVLSPELQREALKNQICHTFSSPLPAVRFQKASISTYIQDLSLDIPLGAWIYLNGSDTLTKALFCDLCFGYLKPSSGIVEPRLQASDVSFLGRSPSTYGISLMDHLTSGVRERNRQILEFVAAEVFRKELREQLDRASILRTLEDKPLLDLDLSEKDLMEIAEANLLLQKRSSVIVDTSTEFYKEALRQGFRHSELFQESGKTVFWINSGLAPPVPVEVSSLQLDFSLTVPVAHRDERTLSPPL